MLIELIRKQIIYHRKKQNLTQDQFAEIVGVSRATVTNLERGEGTPSLEVVESFINYLGIEPDVFLGFNSNRDKNIKSSLEILQMDLDRLKKLL